MSEEVDYAHSDDWRKRAGDKHKAELEAVKQSTEVQLAYEAYRAASRTRYAGEIAKVGMQGLVELNDEADRITLIRPRMAHKLEALEDALLGVTVYNIRRYGSGG